MIIQKNLNRICAICKEHEEKKYEKKLEELSKKTEKDNVNPQMNANPVNPQNNNMTDQPEIENTDKSFNFQDYEIQACVLGMTLVCFGEPVSSELVLRS